MLRFSPNPIALQIGFLNIYWYGIFASLALISGILLARYLARKLKFPIKELEKLLLPLIIFGLIGARLYHVLNEWSYYSQNFLDIFKIWHGGLAIHGAVLGGVAVIFYFRCRDTKFLSSGLSDIAPAGAEAEASAKDDCVSTTTDILLPSLIFAQAIGRFGNFFNQELFGRPTTLPWGIFIEIAHRPLEYAQFDFFHPVFFYQFLWNVVFVVGLIILVETQPIFAKATMGKNFASLRGGRIFSITLIYWSLGRFLIEFLRIDQTPKISGMRLPQIVAFLGIILGFALFLRLRYNKKNQE